MDPILKNGGHRHRLGMADVGGRERRATGVLPQRRSGWMSDLPMSDAEPTTSRNAARGWTAGDPPMPAVYLGHGAPPLVDDELWISQLAAWARDLPRPKCDPRGLGALGVGAAHARRDARRRAAHLRLLRIPAALLRDDLPVARARPTLAARVARAACPTPSRSPSSPTAGSTTARTCRSLVMYPEADVPGAPDVDARPRPAAAVRARPAAASRSATRAC